MPAISQKGLDFAALRREADKQEKALLSPYAAFSSDHWRPWGIEDDHRMPYKRDVDRILHSKAYVRYMDKTQVVYLVPNDHITYRSLHVQLVSAFARGIAATLRLNLDLVEAIALGHDVGHPPFGHEGEHYLSDLSLEVANTPFTHSVQSCRLFSLLEPLNLGMAVYDGFLCHDGGMKRPVLEPAIGKTWEDHLRERKDKQAQPNLDLAPATLEGCLVKICDTISYVGKDIEEGILLGIIKRSDVPVTCLGLSNREILNKCARDIIEQSLNQCKICLSDEVYEALCTLRRFNFHAIYTNPRLKVESKKIKTCYKLLFHHLLKDRLDNEEKSYLYQEYLVSRPTSYLEETDPAHQVIDYISGMTDSFFIRTFERFFVPESIRL